MEDLINLDNIKKNESILKRLFTDIQLNVLKKRLQKKYLNVNERTYYYKFIKPKIIAMAKLFNIRQINIKGEDYILENRINLAINIMNKLEKKYKKKRIIISGSFLFKKSYNDIDIFVVTKYNKEDYNKNNIHITFLPESALESMFLSSLSQISVSNFYYNVKKNFSINLNEILQTYELLINSIINHEYYDNILRDFIIKCEYISKNVILNPKQLYDIKQKLTDRNLEIFSNIFINALTLSYDNDMLKEKLSQQIHDYRKLSLEYTKAKNLGIYVDTYKKVIKLAA